MLPWGVQDGGRGDGGGRGVAAIGREGFGEAGKVALRVDVEDFLMSARRRGARVDGVDEAGCEGGEAGEAIDAAEGVVGEGAGLPS